MPDGRSFVGPRLEMWGGVEASVVRRQGEEVDQISLSGHHDRLRDIDDFAALGLAAIRYPVLWERVAPGALDDADWRWTDARLGRLRELGVRPIAGLLHHGNGPRHTELTAPDFAEKFAAYAERVAARYPWLDAYTPINEPLTTARFCGLYGHWHPHARDQRTCLRILVNEINATRLAMRAIRRINPDAQLVQTEDLGFAHSTPRLARQAAFENERRWLTIDLLTGRVGRDHPLWSAFVETGLEAELEAIAADPCPPDIFGIDHYLTSERFLDERVERYPDRHPARGEIGPYADVEAVRVVADGVKGFERLAAEAWSRYRLPLAATEVHLGCSREEQLRWLSEIWESAQRLRGSGVDIRAVTAWALLGLYDWNSLLTKRAGFYEPGVFDLRAPRPRPTALAALVRRLATGGKADHPVLDAPGWWHRPDRFTYAPAHLSSPFAAPGVQSPPVRHRHSRPLLITGGAGGLARAAGRLCARRGLPFHLLPRAVLDAAEPTAVAAAIAELRPWAILNAAGFAHLDRAERESERCWRDNVGAADVLARLCAAGGIALVSFSSHLVFDGAKRAPYLEEDSPAPLSAYGRAKAEAEQAVLAACPDALVIRAGPLFGRADDDDFLGEVLRHLARGGDCRAAEDVTVSPSYVPDLLNAALDLLIDGETGIWHLANKGATSWAELARAAAARARLDGARIHGVAAAALALTAARPRYSALMSQRADLMPSLDSALDRYVAARSAEIAAEPASAPAPLARAAGWR